LCQLSIRSKEPSRFNCGLRIPLEKIQWEWSVKIIWDSDLSLQNTQAPGILKRNNSGYRASITNDNNFLPELHFMDQFSQAPFFLYINCSYRLSHWYPPLSLALILPVEIAALVPGSLG